MQKQSKLKKGRVCYRVGHEEGVNNCIKKNLDLDVQYIVSLFGILKLLEAQVLDS